MTRRSLFTKLAAVLGVVGLWKPAPIFLRRWAAWDGPDGFQRNEMVVVLDRWDVRTKQHWRKIGNGPWEEMEPARVEWLAQPFKGDF